MNTTADDHNPRSPLFSCRFPVPSIIRVLALCLGYSFATASAFNPPAPGSKQETEEHNGKEDETPSSHSRMVELLLRVRANSKINHPYLRESELPKLQAQLAALPKGVRDGKKWQLNHSLGNMELQLGHPKRAVEYLAEAFKAIGDLEKQVIRKTNMTMLDLGVAYMRQGVSQNDLAQHNADSCFLPIRGGGVHFKREGSLHAIRCFEEVLGNSRPNSPVHLKAKWLLNIVHMALGTYPDDVPKPFLIDPGVFTSDEDFPRFQNIAPQLGLDVISLSGGVVADDFDGDYLLDIMASSSNSADQLRFFRNNGDGTFTERTEEAGLLGLLGGLNMVQADYDNDGDADFFVLRGAWGRTFGKIPNSLVRNNGDGTFTDVTFDAGLGEIHCPTQTAAWADYDNDGDLDLYIGNEFEETTPLPNQLFRNNGDGTFTDVAKQAGVLNKSYSKAVIWGDYDGDGWQDLFVSNMAADNRLYRNLGDGTFVDVALVAGVAKPFSGFPSWFWDFDNDGVLDLFVGAFGGVNTPPNLTDIVSSYLGLKHRGELDRLYRGNSKGGFKDVTVQQNLGLYTLPMGANFGDLDNDGFLDFYLGTGFPPFEAVMPNVMYRNRGGTGFADVTAAGGFGHSQKGHGVAFADFDNDGDQDIFQRMGGAFPGDAFPDAMFENPGFGAHWLKVRLIGVRSNRSGIGARIRVNIIEDGKQRSIFRHVSSGGSFGCNPLRQEIGLGEAQSIETVEVYWPTTGKTQLFENVPLDQFIEVTEGEDKFRRIDLKRFFFRSTENG